MTRTESRAVRSMVLRLQHCCTDAQARLAFSDAVIDGAPFDAICQAMREWTETHAVDVQIVGAR